MTGEQISDLSFTVWGVAQPKGSTRAFVPKGWTRPIVTSDNPKNKGWQQLVAEAAGRARDKCGSALLEGPIKLRVAFYLPRPKSLPRKVVHHIKKPDVDKLLRSVKDGLKSVAWHDDSQVVDARALKFYADEGVAPHARVVISSDVDKELREFHEAILMDCQLKELKKASGVLTRGEFISAQREREGL